MAVLIPREGSLVLYRGHPARVQRVGEKLDLLLPSGETARVRLKDVELLHAGPLASLADLRPLHGEVEAAWELLAGGTTTLPELAELAFGAYTPVTAWATWQLVAEGLYFHGTPGAIVVSSAADVAARKAAREAEAVERQAWEAFLARARSGHLTQEDGQFLRDVEALALGRTKRSRVLQALGRDESPESAHAFLLQVGYWAPTTNPYPARLEVTTSIPQEPWPALPEEPRRDLTSLVALAVDDALTETPDDALSLEGSRLWIHVADPAAVVLPDTALDREARARTASLYLPEGTVPMLPPAATEVLGLGLQPVSPALSFGLDLGEDGRVTDLEIVPSWLRVTRLTYAEAETRLDEEPLRSLHRLAEMSRQRRRAAGAAMLELPEVDVKYRDGQVVIRAVPPLRSRTMVEEGMILAGEAIARYGREQGIPLPYAVQEAPERTLEPITLSEMYAQRKTMRPRHYQTAPGAHAGLGLAGYVQITSPMRRCLDLVAHQQLRAHMSGAPLLSPSAVLERIGEVESVGSALRQVERLSNQHFILVYLMAHPGWQGEGILVEKRGMSGVVLIPELAWEAHLHLPGDLPVDSRLQVTLSGADLPRLDARFRATMPND